MTLVGHSPKFLFLLTVRAPYRIICEGPLRNKSYYKSPYACKSSAAPEPPRANGHRTMTTDVAQFSPDIQQREDHLSIRVKGQAAFRTSYIWLRDHCKCSECYTPSIREMVVDIITLPQDIKPKKTRLEDENLVLTWPDDHVTTYSLKWLQENAPGRRSIINTTEGLQPLYWDRKRIMKCLPGDVPLDALRDRNSDALKKIAEDLHVYGITFVSGLEATEESTMEAIRLITPPMNVFYGKYQELWNFVNDDESAASGLPMPPLKNHTDNSYFEEMSGGMALHLTHQDGHGGEVTLVDGFHAAQKLKKTHPEHYETLRTLPTVLCCKDTTYDFRCYHNVLRHHVLTGELQQVRFNPPKRYDLSYLSYEDSKRFYAAYRAFGRIAYSPDQELVIKLKPGRLLIADNWRLLHGRTAFTGKRALLTVYLGYDDIQNLKRAKAKLEV